MALTALIVDDHELVREGLRAIMELTEDITVVGEASTDADAVKSVRKFKPDVAVVDVGSRARVAGNSHGSSRSATPTPRC